MELWRTLWDIDHCPGQSTGRWTNRDISSTQAQAWIIILIMLTMLLMTSRRWRWLNFVTGHCLDEDVQLNAQYHHQVELYTCTGVTWQVRIAFLPQHGRSSFNQIFLMIILWIGQHLPRNGTSWARLLWTDTRVAASISRETFSHSSLHSALSQGPWWRPLEFVRATPFLWFFSKVICDICCPVIANSDMALERMLGLSPATSPATTSNGSSTKTT